MKNSLNRIILRLRARWVLLLALLLCAMLSGARIHAISHTGRYMGDVDERYLFHRAVGVLSGDLNPHFFKYPSLPIYLTAASMKGSMLLFPLEATGTEVAFHVPYKNGQRYHPSRPMQHARLVFSVLASLFFFLVAILGKQLTGSWAVGCLAPLLVALSPAVQRSAVEYQNVDLPATLFSLSALASALLVFAPLNHAFWRRSPLLICGVLPGVLSGFAVACKYNSGVVLVSCALGVLLAPQGKSRAGTLLTLGLSAALAFFIAVPYSILDFEHFRADVLYEMRHYKNGHPGHEGDPGLPQLIYYLTHIKNDFGNFLSVAAMLGVFWGLRKHLRPTIVVLSFPLLMLLHMSTNRVHFLRTILPVFALVSVFASVGFYACFEGLTQLGSRYAKFIPRRFMQAGTGLALIGVLGIIISTHHEARRLFDRNIEADTRDQAAEWLADRGTSAYRAFVARDLWMPKADLPESPRAYFDRHDQQRTRKRLLASSLPAYFLVPHYGVPENVPRAVRRNQAKRTRYLGRTKRLAQSANRDQQRFMEKLGARSIQVIPGNPTALEAERGKALSTNHPQIEVYYWPGKAEPIKS